MKPKDINNIKDVVDFFRFLKKHDKAKNPNASGSANPDEAFENVVWYNGPQEGQAVLRLELTTRGIGRDTSLSTIRDWFAFAHESIVLGFADLTAYHVQKDIWKLQED